MYTQAIYVLIIGGIINLNQLIDGVVQDECGNKDVICIRQHFAPGFVDPCHDFLDVLCQEVHDGFVDYDLHVHITAEITVRLCETSTSTELS